MAKLRAGLLSGAPVVLMAAACVLAGLGGAAGAGAVTAGPKLGDLAPPSRGYSCLPFSDLGAAKAGKVLRSVRLDGFAVTYQAEPSRLSREMLSYPGKMAVTEGARSWPLPAPADPKDLYFELGALCAFRLAPGATPDVLAEGFWGGAHCCYGPTIYQYSKGAGYRVVEDLTRPGVGKHLHWDPNAGFTPEKIGAGVVLESADGAFPYAFGCYACTPAPVHLFTVAGGTLSDVTTRYPSVIRSEAKSAWQGAAQAMGSAQDAGVVEGPLAEWAADSCELGQGAQMWRTLEGLQATGKLAAAEKQSFNNKQPFPVQLKAFLLANGYCRGQL